MKCSIQGCPGEYEQITIAQTFRHNDRTPVIEDIPADVCNVCGDTLFSAETVQSLEQLLASSAKIERTVPALSFPIASVLGESAVN